MTNLIDRLRGALRSKTIWFNPVAIPVLLALFDHIQSNLGLLASYLSGNKMQVLAIISIDGNIFLRALVKTPLEAK